MYSTHKSNGEAASLTGSVMLQEPYAGVERRSYQRDDLQIELRLERWEGGVPGHTVNISATGLRLMSEVCLAPGTPLMLRCCLGGAAQLHVVGQVVYCRPSDTSVGYMTGIKFAALREWETTLLVSAVTELTTNAEALGKAFLAIHISTDSLALEAAVHGTSSVSDDTTFSTSPEQVLPRQKKKNRKFTPDPAWVLEMDHYLAPYRQAIWESQLVQETASGALSLEQVKGWSIQFYPFIELFPQFMATYLAKATDPMSRGFLIDNLRVEKRHADQWIDMAKGFGVPKEDLFTTPVILEVEALTHWMWSITNRGSFVEAVAATNYAIEGVTQGIATIMVKGFMKYQGQDGVLLDKRAYMWMEAHSAYDDLHPYQALEIMKLHATTSEIQQKVTHAAQRSLEYLFLALEACYAFYGSGSRKGEHRVHLV
ncbi:MAG TPA: iron-containing redox enzyme family protein [Nitrospirales bacterium]